MLARIINGGVCIIVFLLPLYLIRFRVGWLPTNILEVLIGGLFFIWLLKAARNNTQFPPFAKGWFLPIFLIFTGATLSVWFSGDLITGAGIWRGWFVLPLAFMLVVVENIKEKKEVGSIFKSLALSGAIVAIISLFYFIKNDLTYDGRLGAFYLSPNHLSMYLSPVFILSLYLYPVFEKNIYKIILIISHFLLLLVIVLTFSRSAWLGLAAGLIFILLLWLKKKWPKKIWASALIFLLFFLFIAGIAAKEFDLLNFPSFKSRLAIWQSALEIIKDHPLIGIGPGMFQKYYLDYQKMFPLYPEWSAPQPHNIFLAFWLQAGIIGLIGFFWLIVLFFKKGFKKEDWLGIILMAAMVYTLVHGLFDTTYWKNDLSIIFWLTIGLMSKVGRLSD